MTLGQEPHTIVRNVAVPTALIAKPERFGGQVQGDCNVGDLVIQDNKLLGLICSENAQTPDRLILPKFVECHVHLDKCYSFHRVRNPGGDLAEAIDAQFQDKLNWTPEDISARAQKGLEALLAAGCGAVRSHVDWSHGAQAAHAPPAWDVLNSISESYRDRIDLQLAALVSTDDLLDLKIATQIAQKCAQSNAALGVFVFDQPNILQALHITFDLAEKYGLALDFHVDEGLSPGLDGLSAIAQIMIDRNHTGPVLCGHACSLANFEGSALRQRIDQIAAAGISIVTLPSTNLYLQGRNGGTPERRGLTRVKELLAQGVNIAVGIDNVQDAFYPLGAFDPRKSLALAIVAAQLNAPFGAHLKMITSNASHAIGKPGLMVDQSEVAQLSLHHVCSTAQLLSETCGQIALSDAIERRVP